MQDDINKHRANALNKLKEIYSDIGVDMPNTSADITNITNNATPADSDRVEIKY